MADKDDALDGARQLGDSSYWNKTSEQIANEFTPNTKGRARRAIEAAARFAYYAWQKRPSISPYRASDAAVGNTVDFAQWADGHVHQLLIEQGALFGDPDSVEQVKALAATGDKRAQALVAHLGV
ncbi:hypothetical protein K8O93_01260 [Gordonia bronchialis]|uniref:hypothetical protein n=1 Tax=Gordonia bronchialis TaxID=2054 RepID=UPI001CBD849A|nr:hypothetical protein [Gordonia bronchialis]UAK38463.1 hypothetical protein K8O93_01260 [Gordonia bronchialis]